MKKERIIRRRLNRYDKTFIEQAIRMWMNNGRSAEMTSKGLA